MSIVTEITRINTNIVNSYTAVDNKNGTLPQVQNSANLASAIDSIEVIEQATAEGESLSLTNTKAMPYSDYVVEGKSEQNGEPSPSNPSEIHSVADDSINLFDLNKCGFGYINSQGETEGNTENANVLTDYIKVESNKSYTIFLNTTISNIGYALFDSNKNYISRANNYSRDSLTISISSGTGYIRVWLNKGSLFTNLEEILSYEPMIEEGTTASPYIPHGIGTVTIKQRGKNLFDIENYSKSGYNVTITNPLKGLIAGDYTISCQNKHTAGSAIIFSNEINGSQIGGYFTGYDFGRTLTSKTRALTQEQLNAKYMIFQGQDSSITQEVLENMQIQIEKDSTATSYEPYQSNDKVFQTEPLRSLPNGVKDTIEDDGIHRRVGRIVLDGTDNWSFATEGDNTNGKTFYSNRKSDMKGLTYQEAISLDDIFVISDTFKGYAFKKLNETPRKLNFISLGINTLLINISNETGVKTVEEFKTYLNNNPIVVQYQLNEEVIEPLTQNQATTMLDIIKTGSYEGTTNIYTDEDVKPTMKVEYYKKG